MTRHVTPPNDSAPYRLTLTNAAGNEIATWPLDATGFTRIPEGWRADYVIRAAIRRDRLDSIGGAA